jgi:hypothetical protein
VSAGMRQNDDLFSDGAGSPFGAVQTIDIGLSVQGHYGAPGEPEPPVSVELPSIAGVAQVGSVLSASAGSWSGSPAPSLAYQWRRCDAVGEGCAPIGGATGTSYVLVGEDEGRTLRVVVTATNSAGEASAESAATGVVQPVPSVESFGRSEVGNMYGQSADRKRVSRFVAPAGGSLVALSAFVDGLGGGSGVQQFRLVVYADQLGLPGVLLGETVASSIAAGVAGAWVRLDLASPVLVTAGSAYHLGIHSGPTTMVARYGNVLGVSAGMRQNDDLFSDGAGSPFGAVQTIDIGLSVQGHYGSSG